MTYSPAIRGVTNRNEAPAITSRAAAMPRVSGRTKDIACIHGGSVAIGCPAAAAGLPML